MEKLIYSKKYSITTDNLDYNDQLTPCAIFNYFQDIAGRHATLLNVGFDDLMANNCIWVVLRVKYEIVDNVKPYDDLIVTTWPKENGRIDYNREYKIQSTDNKDLIIGSSQWVIVDVNTRMIKRGNFIQFKGEFIDLYNFEKPLSKLIANDVENMEFICEEKIPYSYLDHNGHMNNSRYAEIIYNALRLSKNEKIKEMQIDFIKETMLDETLKIYLKKIDNKYFVEGLNGKGFSSFRAEITLF